ncbi:MAG TPA: hypothetical protein PKA41_08630 [Verrucomicrobiota bacterium]|nr:hypothetical protein [Verrucomicrobiota bacterium]
MNPIHQVHAGPDGKWCLNMPTVTASLKQLAKSETTGRNYGRIYAYDKYLKILNGGTEPLP